MPGAAIVTSPLAPFPWFGGKRSIASEVWQRFGDVANFVEPFCGSAAMWLAAPNHPRVCTLNDVDGLLINFWRAVQAEPDSVAQWADWPVSEADLFSRHVWLVNQRGELTARLQTDPAYYDAKAAGWWLWGACSWIGSGWASGEGPWSIADGQIVNIRGNAGQGVNRKLPHLGNAGRGEIISAHLRDYMREIADVLRVCRIACGSWERVCTPAVTHRHGLSAVFLDPPYGDGNLDYSAGGNTCKTLAANVKTWCVENGNNPLMRIALCGYDDIDMPDGWTVLRWKARKGYQTEDNDESNRETIWFSPYCLTGQPTRAEMQPALFTEASL